MPVRSSVCTYSPVKVSLSTRFNDSTSSSASSIGQYRSLTPLASTTSIPIKSDRYSSSSSSALYADAGNNLYNPRRSNFLRSTYSTLSAPTASRLDSLSSTTSSASWSSSTFDGRFSFNDRSSYSSGSTFGSTLAQPSTSRYSNNLRRDSTSSPKSDLGSYRSLLSETRSRLNVRNYPISSTQSCSDDDYESLDPSVPRGLINLGNTCYMNASLQSLYSSDLFRAAILNNTCNLSLCSELSNLFKSMKTSTSAVSPANFKSVFSRYQSKFAGVNQQDAQEFLRYLINGIHEECNRAAKRPRRSPNTSSPTTADQAWLQYRDIVDDSFLVDIVVGQLCSTICCSICNNKSDCWDPFWDLSLPLARAKYQCRLSDLLDDFTSKETLDFDERPICSKCKCATRSTKQISFYRLPKLLILHLKKFSNDGYKITNSDVLIDRQLKIKNINYQLQACISHHGHSSSSGHYTSYCRYGIKWFHFNDDRVRDVTSAFDKNKLPDAYVLFYSQIGSRFDEHSSSISSYPQL